MQLGAAGSPSLTVLTAVGQQRLIATKISHSFAHESGKKNTFKAGKAIEELIYLQWKKRKQTANKPTMV